MDLIDRQAAIDVLNKHSVMFEFHLPHEFHEVKEEIRGLPSAQPTQTNAPNALKSLDCISRQAAIDALRLIPCDLGKRELEDAIKAVEQLPPTRTEPLTIRVNNELTKEEYEKLMHDIKDAPIVLLASAQPEERTETHACDCISRQAAIEALKPCAGVGNRVLDKLRALPSAEPKTGEWISDRLVSTNGGTYGVRRCSECEAYYQDIGYGWNYCPNCGAKMEDTDETY